MTQTNDSPPPALQAAELEQHPFFETMPLDVVERVARCSARVDLSEGARVLTQGEPANSFLAVQHGRIAVGVHVPDRGFVTIETVQRGEVLGWSWLFPPHRWSFDAVVTAPAQAIRVNAACIRPYLEEDPAAGFAFVTRIARVMEDRLHSARMRLMDLYGGHDDHDD